MQFIWTVAWRLLREGRFQSVLMRRGVTLGVAVVALVVVYHGVCAKLLHKLAADDCSCSHRWFRWFNEIPVLLLIVVVVLVVVKPF